MSINSDDVDNINNDKINKRKHRSTIYGFLMMLPIFCFYYVFLFWMIYEKKKYGLNINIAKINFKIVIITGVIGYILAIIIFVMRKVFVKFEESIYYELMCIIFIILAYIATSGAFASLWLFNI